MSDDLSAILETTTAERLATGVQQQLGHASLSQPPTPMGVSSRSAMRRQSKR
jgi:hypothetical protein